MTDEQVGRILSTLKSQPRFAGADFEATRLPGDASNRGYVRLRDRQGSGQSLIVMIMNAPEAFKSEEAGAATEKPSELPFLTVDRELKGAGLFVPEVFYVSEKSDFLVLEDFGDELLYDRRQKEPALEWYKKALESLAQLQKIQPFPLVQSRSFSEELLHWETEHFLEYALLKREIKVSDAALNELRQFLKRLVDSMANSPVCVTHRDYHSKNLMIVPGRDQIGIIDFQDALMGPQDYDLASLLRDSYVTFSDEEEELLLRHYETAAQRTVDRQVFGRVSLQRNLKAIGRFHYIHLVKGRPTHLPFVAPSLRRVFRSLRQLGELKILSLMEGLFGHEAKA
jgi:aminoglycoside/choline kinase family phosphotransferase